MTTTRTTQATSCTVLVAPGTPCQRPAVSSWTSSRGNVFAECIGHNLASDLTATLPAEAPQAPATARRTRKVAKSASTAPVAVQVFGPNLRGKFMDVFHVHAAGCADCRNYGRKGRLGGEGGRVESFVSFQALVESYYGDQMRESVATWDDGYESDFKVFPCVKGMPRTS